MNTPNPLVPQGSLLEQPRSKSKSNLFIAVFVILAIHVVLFTGLLVQGCRREKPNVMQTLEPTNTLAAETNYVPAPSLPVPSAPSFTTATTTAPPEAGTVTPQPLAATPATPVLDTTEPAGPIQTYTIIKGDTFAKIAKDHGLTVTDIVKANPNVDARKLHVGQVVQIPAPSKAPNETASASAKSPTESGGASVTRYTVKAGDNLTKIARAHAITITALRKANNLKTDQLQVGQKLKIPAGQTPKSTETTNPTEPALAAPATSSASTSNPARL